MKRFGRCFSAVWMLCGCFLVYVKGHKVCQQKLISRVSFSTELQSDVLLPCLFEAALFRSNLTTKSSAVWTQINTTVHSIVVIPVNDQPKFWNDRHGRIKAFSYKSANFSIMIRDVQRSDLGLYRCELFRESNCSLGYREISLTLVEFSLLQNWQLIVAGGGGLLLLCLITVCVYCARMKRESDHCAVRSGPTVDEMTYTTVVYKALLFHGSP
ncbi:hypothetical protein R3I93_003313 [Phoxinus phoxinus]|uniref:Uncharacterized protein n=1 Tax=Phoxinus phoxinus TaxID=58324 RepID=A0AAN9HFE2_9TELE